MIPKQIIYPLRYVRPLLLGGAEKQERLFVQSFSELLGLPIPFIPVGRARAGIYLLTKASISKQRTYVLLSPYTIPDVVNMIRFAGGTPIFIDHERQSTHIDLIQLESRLSDRVACAWLTHYHVNQSKMADAQSLCAAKGVRLFEDCAISLGGTINGTSVGLQSDGGVFSLSAYKSLNYFWGGGVVTNDPELEKAVSKISSGWRRLRVPDYATQIARTLKYDLATRRIIFDFFAGPLLRRRQRRSRETLGLKQPRIESVAFDQSLQSRPSAGAFAEWNRKIKNVRTHLAHRREIASIYDQKLCSLMVSQNTPDELKNESCFVNYPVWIGEERRNEIYKRMILDRFDVGLSLYPNVHKHSEFAEVEGISLNAMKLVNSVISLPTHPRVSVDYAQKLANRLVHEL
jgi:perosamine synthetase